MFESLLNKILQKQLGNFIKGFDANNLKLGVWSGNVVVENVSLKPEIIDLLELPFKLQFSSIGKLQVSVPWNKLSSAPVEVLLEKVLIIISPINKNNWKFSDYLSFHKKSEILEKFTKNFEKKLLERQNKKGGDKKEAG